MKVTRDATLQRLRGGLIVSVQADAKSLLNTPEAIALLARCAVANAAVAVRVEGVARLTAVRSAVTVPIIGIVKQRHTGYEPYITSTAAEVDAVVQTGAEIVACDATARERAGGLDVATLVRHIHASGRLAMADCATTGDMEAAIAAEADVIATTLAGYTAETAGRPLPALDLVAFGARRHPFTVCEGGIATPLQARSAFESGASAIVVGTAITNVDRLVRNFACATPRHEAAT